MLELHLEEAHHLDRGTRRHRRWRHRRSRRPGRPSRCGGWRWCSPRSPAGHRPSRRRRRSGWRATVVPWVTSTDAPPARLEPGAGEVVRGDPPQQVDEGRPRIETGAEGGKGWFHHAASLYGAFSPGAGSVAVVAPMTPWPTVGIVDHACDEVRPPPVAHRHPVGLVDAYVARRPVTLRCRRSASGRGVRRVRGTRRPPCRVRGGRRRRRLSTSEVLAPEPEPRVAREHAGTVAEPGGIERHALVAASRRGRRRTARSRGSTSGGSCCRNRPSSTRRR